MDSMTNESISAIKSLKGHYMQMAGKSPWGYTPLEEGYFNAVASALEALNVLTGCLDIKAYHNGNGYYLSIQDGKGTGMQVDITGEQYEAIKPLVDNK